MADSTLLRNSSLLVAYMGCLGWGSAYFYGWGNSFYYGYPWWVVGAGVDDVARSLFYAVTVIVIFFIGWIIGVVFFFVMKQKTNVRDLSFARLFIAVFLLFTPPTVEFSVIQQKLALDILLISLVAALITLFIVRYYRVSSSIKSSPYIFFVKKHLIEIVMVLFIIYFWAFSLIAGWYKPILKKEYQVLYYNNAWYYVLARYDNRLVLSETFKADGNYFIIFNTSQSNNFKINSVRTRL
ncbi:hypothetical protein ACVSDK_004760 [Escherichia coli]